MNKTRCKLFGFLFLIGTLPILFTSCNSDFVFQKLMETTAKEINKKCPMTLSSDLVWDNVEVLPNKTFKYNYTLKNVEAVDVDTVNVKKERTPEMVKTIQTESSLKIYREHKTTFIYTFKDKNGSPAYTISITPEMYNQK